MARLTRRTLLASAAGGGVAAAAAGGGFVLGREGESEQSTTGGQAVPFHGRHQAGIATPAQDRLHFAAFDVEDGLRGDDLRGLLREWSRAAERMTAIRDRLRTRVEPAEVDFMDEFIGKVAAMPDNPTAPLVPYK